MADQIYHTPKIKSFIEYVWQDGVISFFKIPGISIDIKDEKKFIFTVCQQLDGTKHIGELKKQLAASYPNETLFLEDLLSVLDKEYLLEDSACNLPTVLSTYDITRWARNIDFFSAYSSAKENKYIYQKKLSSLKVAILGLGGVGSNILYNLAAIGIKSFSIADYDHVELKNLNRQILYKESDLGMLKTEAASKRLKEFLASAHIKKYNIKILSTTDVEKIVSGHDLVISAADEPREKILDWVNSACIKSNIPYMCGGVDSQWATYYTIIPGKTGCMECWKQHAKQNGAIYQDITKHNKFKKAITPNTAIMPLMSILSGLVTNEIIKLFTNISAPISQGKLWRYDFTTSELSIVEDWYKNPDCYICRNLN